MEKTYRITLIVIALTVGLNSFAISERCAWWSSLFSAIPGGIIAGVAAAQYYDRKTGGEQTGKALVCGAITGVLGALITPFVTSDFLNRYTPRYTFVRWQNAKKALSHQYPLFFKPATEGGFNFLWVKDRKTFNSNIDLLYTPLWFSGLRGQNVIDESKKKSHVYNTNKKIHEANIIYSKLNSLHAWLNRIKEDLENSTENSKWGYDPNKTMIDKVNEELKEIISQKAILESNKALPSIPSVPVGV